MYCDQTTHSDWIYQQTSLGSPSSYGYEIYLQRLAVRNKTLKNFTLLSTVALSHMHMHTSRFSLANSNHTSKMADCWKPKVCTVPPSSRSVSKQNWSTRSINKERKAERRRTCGFSKHIYSVITLT